MSEQKVWTEADGLWGLCPHCHKVDGGFDVGRGNWLKCDTHKTKWLIGNLFTVLETKDEQRAIYDREGYGAYTEVEPFFPENFPW